MKKKSKKKIVKRSDAVIHAVRIVVYMFPKVKNLDKISAAQAKQIRSAQERFYNLINKEDAVNYAIIHEEGMELDVDFVKEIKKTFGKHKFTA